MHWSKWIEELISRPGWEAYFVTFLFKPISGSEEIVLECMTADVSSFYGHLLTRSVRYPRALSSIPFRPILLGGPDWPVAKCTKTDIRGWEVNDGVHMHAICTLSKRSRNKGDLLTSLATRERDFFYGTRFLRNVHVVKINRTPERVGPYILKCAKRLMRGTDSLWIYPPSLSEPTRGEYLGNVQLMR